MNVTLSVPGTTKQTNKVCNSLDMQLDRVGVHTGQFTRASDIKTWTMDTHVLAELMGVQRGRSQRSPHRYKSMNYTKLAKVIREIPRDVEVVELLSSLAGARPLPSR